MCRILRSSEGAIGYRHFDVVSGEKNDGGFRLKAGGDFPPFGAEVKTSAGGGRARWPMTATRLAGVKPGRH
ncbi:hypothetical protein KCP69_07995 [Salmonella enterica subsp. enterica]|nr:hypothetical protein KCP69_07995 [Salmonella enterica subsp. enterica]